MLRELIATMLREGHALPEPSRASKRRPLVVPSLPIALKAAFYEAYRQTGISQRRLARDLVVAESEVRRMLNPAHATKAGTIDAALRRLGRSVFLEQFSFMCSHNERSSAGIRAARHEPGPSRDTSRALHATVGRPNRWQAC